jgi:hypothetical protein
MNQRALARLGRKVLSRLALRAHFLPPLMGSLLILCSFELPQAKPFVYAGQFVGGRI